MGGSIEDDITRTAARLIALKYLTINDADVYAGTGSPNGSQIGKPGDYYFQNTLDGGIWRKTSGFGNTGWTEIIGGSSSGATIPYGLSIVGVNDAIVGSTETTTLRFAGAPTPMVAGAPLADWVTVTTTAELGTHFVITLPGKYDAALSLLDQSAASESSTIAITIDDDTAPLPFPSQPGVIAVSGKSDDELPSAIGVSSAFFVTQAMIDSGDNIFRAQALPGTDITISMVRLQIMFLGGITIP